jgi:hypothetical protein
VEAIVADLSHNFVDMSADIVGYTAGLAPALQEKRKEIIMQADNALNDLQVSIF